MNGRRSAERGARNAPGELQRFVLGQLLRLDPLNLNYGGGAAVYEADAAAITAGLWDCGCEEEVCTVVYAQLGRSFGTGAVGSREIYRPMAEAIWTFERNLAPRPK